jgi:PKD repeat protein
LQFRDLSAGIPTSWQWTFTGGSPSNSTIQNPVVTYPIPGLYTVKLRVTNSFGSDSLTKVNYVRVRGAALSAFNCVSPPNQTRIGVASGDTTKVNFIWQRSSSDPTVSYKWKIRKIGTTVDYTFPSNSSGSDTVLSITRNVLDSIASLMGLTGDSVRCTWRAWAYNGVDSLQSTNGLLVTLVRGPIGIQIISGEVPVNFALYNNFPNPFNPLTKIRFDVPAFSDEIPVELIIYDISGREVTRLVNGNFKAGSYAVSWDASSYSSGIYFYRMIAGEFTDTKKMILIK